MFMKTGEFSPLVGSGGRRCVWGEELPNQGSKVRRIENVTLIDDDNRRHVTEFHARTNRIEKDFMPVNQVKKIGSVRILKWGLNGKENHVQYLSHHNPLSNSGTAHYTEEVQVLEENIKGNTFFRKDRNSLNMGSTSNYKNAARSSDDEIEEIFPPSRKTFKKKTAEVVETYRSPQLKKSPDVIEVYQPLQSKKKVNDNEVQILKERSSSSKEGHGLPTSFPRKPFKAIDPCVPASSTPILFTSRRALVRSPDQRDIVQSPSMSNGIESCQYRTQSSLLSVDSNSSRKNNTLLHMKRAEENQIYNKVFKSSYGADRLLPQHQQPLPPTSHKSADKSFDGSRRWSGLFSRPAKMPGALDTSLSSKDALPSERINVSVERTNIKEPSTSASRQSDDTDLQYLGEVHTSVHTVSPSYAPDVMEELLQKYEKLQNERMAQAKQEEKSIKLLEERNRLAYIDRQKQVEHELVDQIKSYLKVVEEPTIEVEEEKEAPLPELTDAMNAEINKALAAPPDAVLVSAFNLTIKGRDMRTLKDLAWLNDEIINFYMNMIIERGKADNYPSVHAFNTFFFPKLISTGYDSLKRWTKKVDIFAHDYLLVPVHRGMHWCMAIIDMKEKVIRYYDSMDGRFPQCMDALMNYLHKESLDKKKQPFDSTGWAKEHAEGIPQQNNGSDCGMFACMYAEYISRGAEITFTQENMPYFRRKAVYEILKAKLLC
ncbi:sentrin-specific protease 1-like isoform X2 [Thrips palmi]|uniref:Sentrin-specific protease 1-like isoform X2 n=1 Tax=Thrips palmi TaxID=161013 RepID=A0A6P8YHB5_THRPL|nr:sentrin-specific protease 1-like isoform X2 [Thrips palmi]